MLPQALHRVEVSAPSRLHMGLLTLSDPLKGRFGGAGLMIQSPRMRVRVVPDRDFVVRYGPWARRAAEVAQMWARRQIHRRQPLVRVEVDTNILPHVGLGSGTQLSLALARALNRCFELEDGSPHQFAASVDRAQRSHVGTFGFLQGGLIADTGFGTREDDDAMPSHVPLPEHWRILLIRVGDAQGKNGVAEQRAFQQLANVPRETTRQLHEWLLDYIVPAAQSADLATFGEFLFRYGQLAGSCFSTAQQGVYSSPSATAVVAKLRNLGIAGVAQSSWGPTVFAICPSEHACRTAWQSVQSEFSSESWSHEIAAPDNRGAMTFVDGQSI